MPSLLGACQSGKKDFCWFSVGIHTSILFKWPKWWHGQLFYLKSIEKAYRPVLSSLNIHRFIHTKRSLSDVTPTSPTLIASGLLASIYHCVNLYPFHILPPPDSLACSLFCSSPLFPQSQQPPAWSCLLTTWSLGIQHTFSTPWLFDFFFLNSHCKARTDASLTNSV